MKKCFTFLLLALMMGMALPAAAQKVDIKVDGKKIYDIIMRIAKDEALGRKPNTPEFDREQESQVPGVQELPLP